MAKITYLLHEFQYFFPTKFSEMKGIFGDMGSEGGKHTQTKDNFRGEF